MTTSDISTMNVFRAYGLTAGQMLCFHGPTMEKHGASLKGLTARGLLQKERFAGAYSLTFAGYHAMQKTGDELA